MPSSFSLFERTKDILTCGITNIPLTKPAKVYFFADYEPYDNEKQVQIYNMFESMKIPFRREDNYYSDKVLFTTLQEIEPKQIKMIFRNFRTLRPKLDTKWRYLFWEIDTVYSNILHKVLDLYYDLGLPVYYHRSMKGYHFLSVKPITTDMFENAIQLLRPTNEKYPPITLRINPNKYVDEEKIFYDGGIQYHTKHSDTIALKRMIEKKDWIKIGQQYQIVWYKADNNDIDNKMTIEERTALHLKQIEDSP